MKTLRLLFAFLLACAASMATAADPTPAAIDRLFTNWDKPDTPGVALAVVRDGKIVYSRGYGMANLEYGVANSPTTVFHLASVSKQFTAFAIHMLASDGKLSLDDEVRKHLPELSVQGPPITIRHLLHHTSGLRDQFDLLTLAGLRLDDSITENDVLGLIWQQKELNFPPGEELLYSNSGYSLLGLIVRRVSGQSLAAFTQERIFTPLGMKNTRFQESYGTLVKNRAYSYIRQRDGYRYVALSYSNTGATSLFSTAEDLALWANNFDSLRVGNANVMTAMLARGRLNSGRDIGYASGVAMDPYRGAPSIEHSGADAGYRTHLMRMPQQKLAIVLLGNSTDVNAYELSHRVADLFLEGMPGVNPPRTFAAEVDLKANELATYTGAYEVRRGGILRFVADGGKLFMAGADGRRIALHAEGGNLFKTRAPEAVVTFAASVGNDPAPGATWKAEGVEFPMKRVPEETPTAEMLQACVGDYYSDELRTVYGLELRQGKLIVRYPRGVLEARPINRNLFSTGYPMGTIVVTRNAAGACEEFAVTTGRVRNLRFKRVQL